MTSAGCACGDVEYCSLLEIGYPYCRPCGEHHRAPECPIDEQGRALAPCGHTWDEVDAHDHWTRQHRADDVPKDGDTATSNVMVEKLAAALGVPADVLDNPAPANHWTQLIGGVGAAQPPTPPVISTSVDPVNEGDA